MPLPIPKDKLPEGSGVSMPSSPQNPSASPSKATSQNNEQSRPRRAKTPQNGSQKLQRTSGGLDSMSDEELAELLTRRKARQNTASKSSESSRTNSNPSQKKSTRSRLSPPSSSQEFEEDFDNNEFSDEVKGKIQVDPKTGLSYETLPSASPEALKAFKRAGSEGLSLSQLRSLTERVEGFDIDDMNSMAERFLPHLRVPPDKEEMRRLRAKKAQMQKEQDEYVAKLVVEQEAEEKSELERTLRELDKASRKRGSAK